MESTGMIQPDFAFSTNRNPLQLWTPIEPNMVIQASKWKPDTEQLFGVRPIRVNCETLEVVEARCKFCEAFGREKPYDHSKSYEANEKQRTRVCNFASFQHGNLEIHMKKQHPERWTSYLSVRQTPQALTFFKEDYHLFLPSDETISFAIQIPPSIVRQVHVLFGHLGNTTSEARDGPGPLDEDHELIHELSNGNDNDITTIAGNQCFLTIRNWPQFQTFVKCLDSAMSFRQISKCFNIFGSVLHNSMLGNPGSRCVATCARSLVKISMTALSILLKSSWCFSILVDETTHQSKSYLDVRVAFGFGSRLVNLHVLAIPINARHTSSVYSELVESTLQSIGGSEALTKLIAIATDGANTMQGVHDGFCARMQRACGVEDIVFIRCGGHQLHLAVEKLLEHLEECYQFISFLNEEIQFSKCFFKHCPTYTPIRWGSISKVCSFLNIHRNELLHEHYSSASNEWATPAPDASWWICLKIVTKIAEWIEHCIKRMQYEHARINQQYEALDTLIATIKIHFYSFDISDSAVIVSATQIENEIRDASSLINASRMFNYLFPEARNRLVQTLSDAITDFVSNVENIRLDHTEPTRMYIPSTPFELIRCRDCEFYSLLNKYAVRLANHFGDRVVSKIIEERNHLVWLYNTDRCFRTEIDDCHGCHEQFDQAWLKAFAGHSSDVWYLCAFASGLASIPVGTHTVEGEFSILKYLKDTHRTQLTNYSLEGSLHAKQFEKLAKLVEIALANHQ